MRFIANTDSAEELAAQIIGYIRERCEFVLWPAPVRQLRALIGDGNLYAAIALYFARVGERWDEEWLELPPSLKRPFASV